MAITKNFTVKKVLVLAILIRILLIPFLFHPDIRTYHFQSSFLKQGVFNIYDYLTENKEELPLKEDFVYFPLTYLFLGGYQAIVSPLLGGEFTNWFLSDFTDSIYRYLFVLKLPYLMLDISIAFLLRGYFKKERYKDAVFFLWLLNPFTIILIYAFSNIDVLPLFFTVLALLQIKRNRGMLAGVALVAGAGFKAYPLLLIPSLLFTNEKPTRQVLNILISMALFGLIIIPFWGDSFIQSALSSGLMNRVFGLGVDVGLPRKVPYYLLIYLAGFVYVYFRNKSNSWYFYLLVTLTLVASVSFHIQWLLWALPFMLIALVKHKKLAINILLLLTVGIVVPLLTNDRFLSSALYSPISDIFLQTSYIYIFFVQFINPIKTQLFFGLLYFVLSLVLIIRIYVYEKS